MDVRKKIKCIQEVEDKCGKWGRGDIEVKEVRKAGGKNEGRMVGRMYGGIEGRMEG